MQKDFSYLLMMAMRDEARPIIQNLSLSEIGPLHPSFDMLLYTGTFRGIKLDLVLNGVCKQYGVDHIGTQVSSICTLLGIEKLKPSLVINAGTAGGFKSAGAIVGDVYLGHPHVCYHDRRINLPQFREYGLGFYPTHNGQKIANDLDLKTGVISTGNSLDYSKEDIDVMKSYNGVVKDMEAAAIAWVTQQFNLPFLAIKAITDIVDGDKPTEEEFIQNLHFASDRLCKQTVRVLDWIDKNGN
ncbi:MAG: hypothetical protein RBT74_15695 [Tenuifilaceae bacterium]|jgi:nucleoside phosphorylase|nr:hypothetical protein [Tenuifilaceae bacterium]